MYRCLSVKCGHGLRRIRRHRTASLVLHHQGIGGREPSVLPLVDLQPLRMGSSTAGSCLKSPSSRKRIFLFMLKQAMSAHRGVSN